MVAPVQELSCDFTRRAASCVWGSTESTTGNEDTEIAANQWMVGHGPLNQEKFYSLTGFNSLPGCILMPGMAQFISNHVS